MSIKKARHILVEDSVEEIQLPQKIASKKKEPLTTSMSQRQLTREDIKMEDSWVWLDKVLEEEDAYVSCHETMTRDWTWLESVLDIEPCIIRLY